MLFERRILSDKIFLTSTDDQSFLSRLPGASVQVEGLIVFRLESHEIVVLQIADSDEFLSQRLEVLAREDIVLGEGIVPPVCIAAAVVPALEFRAVGIAGATMARSTASARAPSTAD